MSERWLPIPGREGAYEVSDQGRVRVLARIMIRKNGSPFSVRSHMLTLHPQKRGGYTAVNLPRDGGQFGGVVTVHRLVLTAFVGPRPDGMECCHHNDVPTDNRLSNLRWDTPKSNAQDKFRNGGFDWKHRTHCPHGHEYTPENILRKPSDGRRLRCRTCVREASRQYDRRRRQRGVAA